MGLWFRSPRLEPGEQVLWDLAANQDQADRAVGGKLFVTSKRLVFTANRMEARLGGHDWATQLGAVKDLAVADRALKKAMGGGLRRRLRVVLASGSEELFVVKDADDAARRLRQLLGHSQGA